MKLFFIHLLLVLVSVERVPNKVKNLNLKKIHLMSGLNEARFIVRHESHKCKRELNESVCNSKQLWNSDECWCDCKKLEDWVSCGRLSLES